jgi:hypothetical protein
VAGRPSSADSTIPPARQSGSRRGCLFQDTGDQISWPPNPDRVAKLSKNVQSDQKGVRERIGWKQAKSSKNQQKPTKSSKIAPILNANWTARKRNFFTIKELLEFVL